MPEELIEPADVIAIGRRSRGEGMFILRLLKDVF